MTAFREFSMRILITNDDGIHAHGLGVLESIARQLSDDVWVVAPETDQSGVSHSLSLNDPLRLRKVADHRYAVKGTPTDCVIMGVRHILADHRPDLVLSAASTTGRTWRRTSVTPHGRRRPGSVRSLASARSRSARPTAPATATISAGTAPATTRPPSSASCWRSASRRRRWSTSISRIAARRGRGRLQHGAGPTKPGTAARRGAGGWRSKPYYWLGGLSRAAESSPRRAPTCMRWRSGAFPSRRSSWT